MSTEMETFVHERSLIKTELTGFENFFETFKNSKSENIDELKVQLVKVKPLLKQFETVQDEIEFVDPEQENERISFEDAYFHLITAINTFITNHTKQLMPPPITLELPVFDGAFENWLGFYNTFTAFIHNNSSLKPIEKYLYLCQCLKGEAANAAPYIGTTAENYEKTWSIVKKRFGNRKLLIHKYVRALLNLSPISKESAVALRYLSDKVNSYLNALKALKEPVEHWDSLLICLITSKLDSVTWYDWEKNTVSQESPTMNDLRNFLMRRCELLEYLDETQKHSPSNSNEEETEKNLSHVAMHEHIYPHCNQTHPIFRCNYFLTMAVKTRIKTVQKHKLCTNCLRAGHFVKECVSGHCRKCGKKHNTLLHKEDTGSSSN